MKKLIVLFLLVSAAIVADDSFPYFTHWTANRNGINFGFQTTPGCKYAVESTVDFKNWKLLTNFVATEYSFSMSVSSDSFEVSTNQFFRFSISRALDN